MRVFAFGGGDETLWCLELEGCGLLKPRSVVPQMACMVFRGSSVEFGQGIGNTSVLQDKAVLRPAELFGSSGGFRPTMDCPGHL